MNNMDYVFLDSRHLSESFDAADEKEWWNNARFMMS